MSSPFFQIEFDSTKFSSRRCSRGLKLEKLIKPEWRDTGEYVPIDRKTALAVIDAIEDSMEFDTVEFEWDAMRGLVDYYTDVEKGGDGSILLLAETGRRLSRSGSGDKSGR